MTTVRAEISLRQVCTWLNDADHCAGVSSIINRPAQVVRYVWRSKDGEAHEAFAVADDIILELELEWADGEERWRES